MKILLVEDNPIYTESAISAITSKGHTSLHAQDFESAGIISYRDYDSALVDCFFPEKTGSGIRDIGRKVIERITDKSLHERLEKDLVELAEIADMSIPAVNDYFRGMLMGCYSRGLDAKLLLPLEAMKHVSRTLGQGVATAIAQQEPLLSKYKLEAKRDYFKSMSDYLNQSEANQPLGISLAENLVFGGKPFVLCTSTYHHDSVTQPIQNYASKKGWTLVDCPQDKPDFKSNSQYWARALEVLESKSDGGLR